MISVTQALKLAMEEGDLAKNTPEDCTICEGEIARVAGRGRRSQPVRGAGCAVRCAQPLPRLVWGSEIADLGLEIAMAHISRTWDQCTALL